MWELFIEMEQHISVLNDDYTQLAVDVGILKNQMSEFVWLSRVIVAAFVGLILTQFWQVAVLKKDKKKGRKK